MKIDLVAHNPLSQTSGIGRYYRELYAHLQPQVDVRRAFPQLPPLSSHFPVLNNFPLGVKDRRPGSIVHFTQIMGCAQLLWHPVHPSVATVHDLGVLVCEADKALFSNNLDRRILDLQIQGIKKADFFAVNSENTADDLVEHLGIPRNKINFVQLGVDSEHFRPYPQAREYIQAKYQFQFQEDALYLIYVGSELPRKNVQLLLQAVAQLNQVGYPCQLLKIGGPGGDKWRQKTLQQVSDLDISDLIHFFDVVSEAELPVFYSAADLAVTTTLLEGGFAWLAMEAMACQRPVIATENALVPLAVQNAVQVTPAGSLDALVDAIRRVHDDSGLRQKLALLGREIIKEYSWENTAASMMKVYEDAYQQAS